MRGGFVFAARSPSNHPQLVATLLSVLCSPLTALLGTLGRHATRSTFPFSPLVKPRQKQPVSIPLDFPFAIYQLFPFQNNHPADMSAEVRWLFPIFLFLIQFLTIFANSLPQGRFEYKYSFKPPYLAQKDGSVPFWEYGGSKYLISFL